MVSNLAPTLTLQSPTVTVNEGGLAQDQGTWAVPAGDTIRLSASVGTVVENADGTWNWSYTAGTVTSGQSVTITAQDTQQGTNTSTLAFTLVVSNLPPTLSVNSSSISVNQGSVADNHGTWGDPGADVANVTLTASVGTIVENAGGSWDWSMTPTDASQSQTVTITANDGEATNNISTTSFSLVVDNVPPTLTLQYPTVTVNEGVTAQNHGTWSSPVNGAVALTASVGAITENVNGTWNWSYATTNSLQSQTVTITAKSASSGDNTSVGTFARSSTRCRRQ